FSWGALFGQRVQLFAPIAFEDFAIALVMRLDDRRGAFSHAALVRCSRQAHATTKVQLLARLEHGHACGLAVSERRGEDWGASFHVTSPCSRRTSRRRRSFSNGPTGRPNCSSAS